MGTAIETASENRFRKISIQREEPVTNISYVQVLETSGWRISIGVYSSCPNLKNVVNYGEEVPISDYHQIQPSLHRAGLIQKAQFICGDMNSEEPTENYNMAIVEFASMQPENKAYEIWAFYAGCVLPGVVSVLQTLQAHVCTAWVAVCICYRGLFYYKCSAVSCWKVE